jgi:hypothetical protein
MTPFILASAIFLAAFTLIGLAATAVAMWLAGALNGAINQ